MTLEGIDLHDFVDHPLDPSTLRCLRYMHDVEYHTVCYLRDLLVTPAHRDPTVTTFLTLWNVEEMYHGDAIGAVLAAHGELSGRDRVSETRQRLGRFDRIAPAAHAIGSIVVGSAWTAVHMTWGAVNEWTAQAAYARLGQLADHPTLSTLLARIMRQEGRHADFYARQAERPAAGRRQGPLADPHRAAALVGPGRLDAAAPTRGVLPGQPPVHRGRGAGHDPAHRSPPRPAAGPERPRAHDRRGAAPDRGLRCSAERCSVPVRCSCC